MLAVSGTAPFRGENNEKDMTMAVANGPEATEKPASFAFLAGVTKLLTEALGDRLAGPVKDYLDLFGADAVLEIPYGPTAAGDRAEGKAAITAYMEKLRGTVVLEEMTLEALHDAGDTVVLEYRGTVLAVGNNVRFEQRYIAIVGLRDGHIELFREYSNPLLAQRAFAKGAS